MPAPAGFGVWAVSHGLVPDTVVVLEVCGRRSGTPRRTVLVRTPHAGQQYLVGLAGESEWVRNVRAAAGHAMIRHGRARRVVLEEVPLAERAPILWAYLHRPGWSSPAQEGDTTSDCPGMQRWRTSARLSSDTPFSVSRRLRVKRQPGRRTRLQTIGDRVVLETDRSVRDVVAPVASASVSPRSITPPAADAVPVRVPAPLDRIDGCGWVLAMTARETRRLTSQDAARLLERNWSSNYVRRDRGRADRRCLARLARAERSTSQLTQ